jgi:hypothetical protein
MDVAAFREKVAQEVAEHSAEIVELCVLARKPQAAIDFIRRGASLGDARRELQNMRADEADAMPTRGHFLHEATGSGPSSWNDAIVAARGAVKG